MAMRAHSKEVPTFAVAWALRIVLENDSTSLPATFIEQLLQPGGSIDPLRPHPAAMSGINLGLVVQPYFWSLALALINFVVQRPNRSEGEHFDSDQTLTSLEVVGIGSKMDADICSFIQELVLSFSCGHENMNLGNVLYGCCEMCTGRFPCRRYSPTPVRQDICICAHGAAHHSPIQPFLVMALLITHPSRTEYNSASGDSSYQYPQSWKENLAWSSSSLQYLLRNTAALLDSLGPKGIRELLGLRRTTGSIELALPPCRRVLLRALNKLHDRRGHVNGGHIFNISRPAQNMTGICHSGVVPASAITDIIAAKSDVVTTVPEMGSRLTVGGRALCKHSHRGKDGWWGAGGGTEHDKNTAAEVAVLRILSGATWVNTHAFGGTGISTETGVFEGWIHWPPTSSFGFHCRKSQHAQENWFTLSGRNQPIGECLEVV
ncbi:unnamed protein product [Choristocarpus tenellus]